jgi:DNA-binding NarL/FixJ family response regulator
VTARVLIADDQALIRGGLRALLDAAPGFEAVGEAANGTEAVELAHTLRPELVLMDVRMPVMDGIEATRRILADGRPAPVAEAPKVVVLTTFDLDEYVFEALRAGAAGFLLKDTPPERILGALEAVALGELLVSPAITRRLVESYADTGRRSTAAARIGVLTPRETEILTLVGRGMSNLEIAAALFVSESTVKTHVKRVMSKLDLASRAQAVVLAYESGLVRPGAASDR